MNNIVWTLYFQTENVIASFKMNFILRKTNAVNIIMYILTPHTFVSNTDTQEAFTRTMSIREKYIMLYNSTCKQNNCLDLQLSI